MREFSTALICASLAFAGPAIGQTAPTASVAAPTTYSTAETTIGTLLGNPATKAIIDKYIPGLSDNPSIAMAEGMTLRAIQPMAGDKITDEMLAKVDAELKNLKPATK